MEEQQTTAEVKRDEAGHATVGRPSRRGAFQRSDKPKPPPRKRSGSNGSFRRTTGSSRSGKFDESKHKRAADGKFSKQKGRKAKDSNSKKRNANYSIGRGDGMSQNKGNAQRVKKIQAALIKQGFLSSKGGGADGKFGPLTEAAIKKWQKKNGYKTTGALGVGQMKEILTGKKGLARRLYNERQKEQAASKRSKGKGGAFKRVRGPESGTSKIPARTTGKNTGTPKRNQTNMYNPDEAEMRRLEQMARRNEQIERLIDLLYREQMSQKSLAPQMETKVRRVRTPAGERHFGQPIGTIIVRDAPLDFLRIGISDFDGWDKVDGKNGRSYYVGQFDGEKGYVATDKDDRIIVEADNMDDLYKALDRKVGESMDPKASGGLTMIDSDYPGWGKQRGSSGREYYIGKFEGEDGYVATDVDDNVLVEGSRISEVLDKLKKYDAKQPKITSNEPKEVRPTPTSGVSANVTDERVIASIINNGPSEMSEEDQQRIKEWAETASKADLRVAMSAAVAASRGDGRKASTARADVATDILRAQQKANERQEWDEQRKRDHYKRSKAFFERDGKMARFSQKMLDNPEYADPNILNWGDLLTLSMQMSGAIDSYRGIGENDKADKLLAMSVAAQKHREQLQADVDEYLNGSVAERKRLSTKFAAVDPVEQDQYLGLLKVTFGNGSRFDQRKGELESIIRNKKEDAVNLEPIRKALSKYVIQNQNNRGRAIDADTERDKFTDGLADLGASGDVHSLYLLLEMLNTTRGNSRATSEQIARMDEMIPLVENVIKQAEDTRDARLKEQR